MARHASRFSNESEKAHPIPPQANSSSPGSNTALRPKRSASTPATGRHKRARQREAGDQKRHPCGVLMKNGSQLRQNRQRDRDAHNPHEGHAQHKNQPRKTDGAGLPLLRCLDGRPSFITCPPHRYGWILRIRRYGFGEPIWPQCASIPPARQPFSKVDLLAVPEVTGIAQ